MKITRPLLAAVATSVFCWACEDPEVKPAPPAVTSAPVAETTTATASAPPPPPAPKPSHACPDGSEGEGTFAKPCVASGSARMMTVEWTGKMTDKGPEFRVTNNAKLEVLYGQLMVYFYDKAGKQLEVPASGETKARPAQKCTGNIFAGPMKPGEKARLTFSCVNKSHVPDGTEHVEGEMRMVGFTAASGNKSDTYWRNEDIAPDERPKGGVKPKK